VAVLRALKELSSPEYVIEPHDDLGGAKDVMTCVPRTHHRHTITGNSAMSSEFPPESRFSNALIQPLSDKKMQVSIDNEL
jgi:hypothetical protein